MSPEEKINNRVLEMFQLIDELNVVAGGTRTLNGLIIYPLQLKNYYKVLEDTWNYRAKFNKNSTRRNLSW